MCERTDADYAVAYAAGLLDTETVSRLLARVVWPAGGPVSVLAETLDDLGYGYSVTHFSGDVLAPARFAQADGYRDGLVEGLRRATGADVYLSGYICACASVEDGMVWAGHGPGCGVQSWPATAD